MLQAIQNPEMPADGLWFGMSTGALPSISAQKGRGTISFFFCFSAQRHRAVTVHLNEQLVGVSIFPTGLPDVLKEHFRSYQTDFDRAKREHLRLRDNVDRVLQVSERGDEVSHYREEIAKVANALYASRALLYTSDEKLERASSLLNYGLLQILKGDLASIEALARLSLYNSLSWDRSFLEKCTAADGINLSSLVTKLESYQAESGVPLVRNYETALYVHV